MIETVIDSREPLWLRVDLAHRISGLKMLKLPAGDVIISRNWPLTVIERKEIKDFLASIAVDPRADSVKGESKVNRQLREAAELGGQTTLLLEGVWSPDSGYVKIGVRRLGWTVNAFVRKLEQLQRDFPGLVVLPSPNRAATVAILVALVKAAGGDVS